MSSLAHTPSSAEHRSESILEANAGVEAGGKTLTSLEQVRFILNDLPQELRTTPEAKALFHRVIQLAKEEKLTNAQFAHIMTTGDTSDFSDYKTNLEMYVGHVNDFRHDVQNYHDANVQGVVNKRARKLEQGYNDLNDFDKMNDYGSTGVKPPNFNGDTYKQGLQDNPYAEQKVEKVENYADFERKLLGAGGVYSSVKALQALNHAATATSYGAAQFAHPEVIGAYSGVGATVARVGSAAGADLGLVGTAAAGASALSIGATLGYSLYSLAGGKRGFGEFYGDVLRKSAAKPFRLNSLGVGSSLNNLNVGSS